MIFMVLVGGLGTFEGPILGALVLFAIQQQFQDQGSWYLVGLGLVAIVFTLLLPRGLWGVDRRPLRAPAAAGGVSRAAMIDRLNELLAFAAERAPFQRQRA